MIRFVDVKDEALELLDNDLVELQKAITEEIQRRKTEREKEAADKVAKAIQDYLAAGYPIHIRGNVIFYADGYEHDSDFIAEVCAIRNDDGEIIIDVDECCLD
jgi:hypothetical protein